MLDLYLIKQVEQEGERPARGGSATGGRNLARRRLALEIGRRHGSYRDGAIGNEKLRLWQFSH